MQRIATLLAFFLICEHCISQRYPFVHYTPKEGLISNQVRNIYQDARGRLYFTSFNGLSVYDGTRFINYTSKNGLGSDIVNCALEMGDDSMWIITNSNKINSLVKGKLNTVDLKNDTIIINDLKKDSRGNIYAGSEQGLFIIQENSLVKLPFVDSGGKDINTLISHITPFGNFLLLQRDNSLVLEEKPQLYLYNTVIKKIVSEIQGIYSFSVAPDGRVWVSTEKNIMSLDMPAFKKGDLILQELIGFDKLKNLGKYFVNFDREGNCWLGDQTHVLLKAAPDGTITAFTAASGLSMLYITHVFQDREGVTWISTDNGGLNKLVQSNFSFTEKPFEIASLTDISYDRRNDQFMLYSSKSEQILFVRAEKPTGSYKVEEAKKIARLIQTDFGIFGIRGNSICKMNPKGKSLSAELIYEDSPANSFGNHLVDKNGNLILCGKNAITALVNGKTICQRKLNEYADHAASDNKGNLWVATREAELTMYQLNVNDAPHYLEQKAVFSKELSGISPRSIIIDKNDNIWIGTRIDGIHVFSLKNGMLIRLYTINSGSGMSSNFISYLNCDKDNNILACSPAGLDKITIRNGKPVIENLTKQNNIYQSVYKVIIDKNNIAWGLTSNGLLKIPLQNKKPIDYLPTLWVSMVRVGKDTLQEIDDASLSYRQNNLNFYFTATSFIDEKQIMYSYRLQGSRNNPWSEPSNNASVSFIDLPPGEYSLEIKANFPAGRYPEQYARYSFSIAPPWWQTWWFRTITGLLIIGLLIASFRYYYRRKLERQMVILEKEQAIAKERTRIATDMHDDLGAGLSRIKFLSQSIGNKNLEDSTLKAELEKITGYSNEMSEKMGEIVWALNEKNDTLADLVAYTRSYAVEYLANHNILCEADTPSNLPGTFITGEIRRNIFLSVKECLHNIIKHAGATRVKFSIHLDKSIQIVIHDNGKGIDWEKQRAFSNGLPNIKQRMKEIKGQVEFSNNGGTKVKFTIPLEL